MNDDDMKLTAGQLHLSAIVQARHFSLLGHIARMPDETDAKISTASHMENWRRPLGHPCTTWMRTVQQDLKSNNLYLNEASNWPGSELSTLKTDVYVWRYTLLVVHAIEEGENEDPYLPQWFTIGRWWIPAVNSPTSVRVQWLQSWTFLHTINLNTRATRFDSLIQPDCDLFLLQKCSGWSHEWS